jgi:SAM-dependent methyltransferase
VNQPNIEECRLIERLLSAAGSPLFPMASILDFGCGNGCSVLAYRSLGYDAFGVDVEKTFRETESGFNAERSPFSVAQLSPYQLPYEDSRFDFVVSDQVLEHVRDHPAVFQEISRVLKPGGSSVHIYPAMYCPIERHTFVPFGGIIRNHGYLLFWARLGIRNSYQQELSSFDAAKANVEYLTSGVNYINRGAMLASASPHFSVARFADKEFLRCHSRGIFRSLSEVALFAKFIGTFRSTVLYLRK